MTSKYIISFLTSSILACFLSPAIGRENAGSQITFSCEDSQGTLITVARNREGVTKTIFYWKQEALQNKTIKTPKEHCDYAVKQLTDSKLEENDEVLGFIATQTSNIPAICLTIANPNNCSKVISVFAPTEYPVPETIAYETLNAILNPEIIVDETDLCKYRDCPQAMFLKISLFQSKK